MKEQYKTKCLSCKAKYIKEIWLFNYCPICKGKNLKELNKKELKC
jgi:Zn finger protein HypA/HybF involved in hydrogenase expression